MARVRTETAFERAVSTIGTFRTGHCSRCSSGLVVEPNFVDVERREGNERRDGEKEWYSGRVGGITRVSGHRLTNGPVYNGSKRAASISDRGAHG